jgi:hypothetical protein
LKKCLWKVREREGRREREGEGGRGKGEGREKRGGKRGRREGEEREKEAYLKLFTEAFQSGVALVGLPVQVKPK